MCHYVTATLPAASASAAAQAIAAAHRLRFAPVANAFVRAQLRPGEGYFALGTGPCDCGTPLGAGLGEPAEGGPGDRELAKRRKQGWSAVKIERWAAERRAARDRRARRNEAHASRLGPELEQWVSFLRSITTSGEADFVGLLLHWYHGGVDSERIRLAARRTVPLAELSTELLIGIDEDVLYEFRRA